MNVFRKMILLRSSDASIGDIRIFSPQADKRTQAGIPAARRACLRQTGLTSMISIRGDCCEMPEMAKFGAPLSSREFSKFSQKGHFATVPRDMSNYKATKKTSGLIAMVIFLAVVRLVSPQAVATSYAQGIPTAADNQSLADVLIPTNSPQPPLKREGVVKESDTKVFLGIVRQGDASRVRILLEQGVQLNGENTEGVTDMLMASYGGRLKILNALLEEGVDVNMKSSYGITALMFASLRGHLDIVKTLFARGADVNARSDDDVTALMAASCEGHLDVVIALLEKGADVNVKTNDDGMTALMLASVAGYDDVVNALLKHGADPSIKNIHGLTALDIMKFSGSQEIIQLLQEAGSKE
jgi:hypothetical protein